MKKNQPVTKKKQKDTPPTILSASKARKTSKKQSRPTPIQKPKYGTDHPNQKHDWNTLYPQILNLVRAGNHIVKSCDLLNVPYHALQGFLDRFPKHHAELTDARDECAHRIAERIRETARGRGDSMGCEKRDRLIIETDFRILGKWAPKQYGDKVEVEMEHKGTVQVDMTIMTEERRASLIAQRRRVMEARIAMLAETGQTNDAQLLRKLRNQEGAARYLGDGKENAVETE